MTLKIFLKLGRVSNLPTVWTNALAGAVLAGHPNLGKVLIVGLALSAFYIGGMWLNDAFDARIDARERAIRPIPNGDIARSDVFVGGFGFLGAGVLLTVPLGSAVVFAGLGLAGAVVLYDWSHKNTGFSPVIMGAARLFCYLIAALAMGGITPPVVLGALGLWAYTAGLTYAAKQEAYNRIGAAWPLVILAAPLFYALVATGGAFPALTLWALLLAVVLLALHRLVRRDRGDVSKAVVTLIAGMSLYDAVLIASAGAGGLALVAVAGFALTLTLQRVVSGT
ncbi:UbiA family prenyltransferase [Sedimentitalea sp.]|uniref:UbiA family prenyltransferase n=1 Tax=Sedimentitalea sp. TaxID=2048915 RepID=UPI003296848A